LNHQPPAWYHEIAKVSESDLWAYDEIQHTGAHDDVILRGEMDMLHVADQRSVNLSLEVMNHPGRQIYHCDAKAGCFRC